MNKEEKMNRYKRALSSYSKALKRQNSGELAGSEQTSQIEEAKQVLLELYGQEIK